MDSRAKQHLALSLSHEADLRLRSFDRALQQMYAQMNLRGLFHSGARIRKAVALMADAATSYLETAVTLAHRVSDDHTAFVIAASRTMKLVRDLEALLPGIVSFPGGRGGGNDQAAFDAASELFAVIRSDAATKLRIAEFTFQPKPEKPTAAPVVAAKPKRGRPSIKSHERVAAGVLAELRTLSDQEFARLVGEVVQDMMSKAHVALKETPSVDIKRARALLNVARAERAG